MAPWLFALCILLASPQAHARHLHREADYRDAWCTGETEVRLPNGSRADCVTERHAIEIDFAPKWHEAIGQALDYADQTGKSPAILLIIEQPKDWRHYRKARTLASRHHIRLWYTTPKLLQD
jgi:hypothetical protein